MVSLRCQNSVQIELNNLGIQITKIEPGFIEFAEKLSAKQLKHFTKQVSKLGMEILDAKKDKLISEITEGIKIKTYSKKPKTSATYLNEICLNAGYNYQLVSDLFSEVKGINLNQYVAYQQIERMKEILLYEDVTVIEISKILQYKNAAQLTRMFKKITGLTPLYYKKLKKERLANVKKMSSSSIEPNSTN